LVFLNLLAIDRECPYIGFEPQLSAASYVQRVISGNRLRNHSIVPVALSDRTGTA
jgi:hypothetical protein